MYINYNKLMEMKWLKPLKKFFYKKKIEQNCNYISTNKEKVLKNLQKKSKLNVIFYVYDSSKWKCQSLYDLMWQDSYFSPIIIVTKNSAQNIDNPSFQTKEEILETYEFFKKRGMQVKLGYDFESNKHIPLKEFNPDIIIYQHPWYVETTQGPVVCSEFALTYYVPYDISTTTLDIEYNLRFFQYVETYYVVNNVLKDFYSKLMDNKGINLKSVGAVSLDYFLLNKPKKEMQYVIYAPHWTINHKKTIAYSTFKETGQFMLEYAKTHQQFNWLFKPHPMLKKAIIDECFMSQDEANDYYKEWENIGTVCYDGDYYKFFNDSQLMITDCCSFLTEYTVTQQPLIWLVSDDIPEFNPNLKQIVNTLYNVENIEELRNCLDKILIEKNDSKYQERINVMNLLGFGKEISAKKIIEDIKKMTA